MASLNKKGIEKIVSYLQRMEIACLDPRDSCGGEAYQALPWLAQEEGKVVLPIAAKVLERVRKELEQKTILFRSELQPLFARAGLAAVREYWDKTSPGEREKYEALCGNIYRKYMAPHRDIKPDPSELPMPSLTFAVGLLTGMSMGESWKIYDQFEGKGRPRN